MSKIDEVTFEELVLVVRNFIHAFCPDNLEHNSGGVCRIADRCKRERACWHRETKTALENLIRCVEEHHQGG